MRACCENAYLLTNLRCFRHPSSTQLEGGSIMVQNLMAGRPRLVIVWLLCALGSAASLSGCLAPYDQTSDQTVTALQKQLDSHIDAITHPGPTSQPADSAFFIKLRTDIRSLRIRTEARGDPSLKKQAALLDEISTQIDAVEQLEKTNLRSAEAWQTVKDGIGTNAKGFLTGFMLGCWGLRWWRIGR